MTTTLVIGSELVECDRGPYLHFLERLTFVIDWSYILQATVARCLVEVGYFSTIAPDTLIDFTKLFKRMSSSIFWVTIFKTLTLLTLWKNNTVSQSVMLTSWKCLLKMITNSSNTDVRVAEVITALILITQLQN